MSSRICVKNLTKNTTEKDLRSHFGSRGEITDVRIVKTPSGKSRQFGFIGFRSHDQAIDCQKYFNQTFLKSAKLCVEIAKKIGDPDLPSKHLKKTQQQKLDAAAHQDNQTGVGSTVTVGQGRAEGVKEKSAPESAKNEFMNVMKSRGKGKFWSNDDAIPDNLSQNNTKRNRTDDSSGDSAEEDSGDESGDESVNEMPTLPASSHSPQLKAAVSDLGYLKSKVKELKEDSSDDEDIEDVNDDKGTGDFDDNASDDMSAGRDGEHPEPPRDDVEGNTDESRLFVRNLPFSCSEEELSELFQTYGRLTQVHIPLADTGDGRGKGFAFVQFMIPEHAVNAKTELDGTSFQGRLLHIIAAKKAIEATVDSEDIARMAAARKMSSYQLKKEEQRKKSAAVKEGWNASHLRSDTVIEATAEKYGVSRADIMDTSKVSGGDLAVRLAISETQILQENKEYFEAHGVDISAIESATSNNKTIKRSTTTILVKNLPYDLVDTELEDMFARYGNISAFLVPKSKSVALVDFTEPLHARAALKGLAYRRYHHTPLYLEWAPLNVVSKMGSTAAPKTKVSGTNESATTSRTAAIDLDSGDSFSTLYVKNLSFGTTEEILRDYIQNIGLIDGVRAISLPKKTQGNATLPMGFGFIEFKTPQIGSTALSRLNNAVIDGRTLEVKPSDKRLSAPNAKSKDSGKESSKLLVRNVAFQATQKELRDLFSAFGSVKRVRIPKKMGGEHRGFAFVDFGSSKEAAAAKEALANTHLYGRHLVLEWASEEETSVETLRKRSQMDVAAIKSDNVNKKHRSNDGDPFAVDADMDMV